MRHRQNGSGIALPMALFIVMVLFALITMTVVLVNQNIQFTRYSHLKTRAQYIAQAAVNQALKAMSDNSSWEPSHTGEASAYSEDTASDERLKAWIIPHPTKPDLLYVHGQGIINPGSSHAVIQNYETVVRKAASNSGIVYACSNLNGADMIYYRQQGGDWKTLPPAPKMYYNENFTLQQTTPSGLGDFADNMKCLCGDSQGNLYALSDRSGGTAIYKYSLSSNKWTAVKPPSQYQYNLFGIVTQSSAPVKSLSDLATDGKDTLYAVHHSLLGTDTLYRCDLTTGKWEVLPPTRKAYYQNDGQLTIEDIIGGDLKDITADKSGNLYGRYSALTLEAGFEVGVSNTVYKYSAQDRKWHVLPSVPVSYYTIANGAVSLFTDPSQKTGRIKSLAVSRDGTLYGRYAREGVDTLYRFTSSGDTEQGGVLNGLWSTLPPPSKVLYDFLNTPPTYYSDGTEEEPPNPDFDKTAIDVNGTLYMRYHKKGETDTIYSYQEGKESAFEELPAIPVSRYEWDSTSDPPQCKAVSKNDSAGNPCTENNIDDLAAGGSTAEGGGYTYVVVSHY
ncbi:MAG: hypothetical protein RDV48_20480 [Candidatus Eremiobacteraeota bacterium]|nr:hypothetical protein [Candidatus Eremiobacteraeota bacterium]